MQALSFFCCYYNASNSCWPLEGRSVNNSDFQLLPATTQRTIQLREGQKLRLFGIDQRQFRFQYAALRRNHLQVRSISTRKQVIGGSHSLA